MNPLQLFKCLSDDTRLKSVLIISEQNEACVCELMAALELDQPKVSRHLAELRKCNILRDERRGKWVYYQIHPDLPVWANAIIREAAKNNKPYFSDALKKLNLSSVPSTSCL